MEGMTKLTPEEQAREDARNLDNGQWGKQEHSDPEMSLPDTQEEEWVPSPPVYDMPKARLGEAVKRIDRANRRLERAGIEERFTYETEEYIHQEDGDPIGIPAVRLTLSHPVISVVGWKFRTAHEETADGHIVNYGPDKVDELRCDHCGHNRRRGKVYTVTNSDGETKVVGSNCLAAFLGVRPEGLWTLTFDMESLGKDGEEDDSWGAAARTGDVVLPAVDLIGAALAASRDGEQFVPKSRATLKEPSTAFLVERDLRELVAAGEQPERREQAEKILTWVNTQPEGESDYIDNLRSILAGKERWVSRKHFGLGVSAISAYRNALERTVRDRERKAEHESLYQPGHVGNVGERFRDRPMTVMVADIMDGGDYGPRTRVVLRDDETGRQVIWWASGSRPWEVGDKVQVTATVKDHGAYRDMDQTVVSRAMLTPLE